MDFSPLRREIELLPTLVGYFKNIEEADSLLNAHIHIDESVSSFNFYDREGGYYVAGDKFERFGSIVDKIAQHIGCISAKDIEQVLRLFFREDIADTYESFLNLFNEIEPYSYSFVGILRGATIHDVRQIGCYKFIPPEQCAAHFNDRILHTIEFFEKNNSEQANKYCLVEITVESWGFNADFIRSRPHSFMLLRLGGYAHNEATQRFQKLDNTLRFLWGDCDKFYGLGIFDFRTDTTNFIYTYDVQSHGGFQTSRCGAPSLTIPLSDEKFFSLSTECIWDLRCQRELSKYRNCIARAIDWIGSAINQRDDTLAFMQCMFAVECLLLDENEFFSKSIVAQISEYIAFIVADKPEERIEAEKRFKEIYKLRSAIAHGGLTDEAKISSALPGLVRMSREVVLKLLTKEGFARITSKKELHALIQQLRYS